MTSVLNADVPTGPIATTSPTARLAKRSLVARSALLLGATAVAYHHSLGTLFASLGVDSPLAYLGLVPFISAALIVATARPTVAELEVHDRYLDRMIATVTLVISAAVMLVLPARLSTFFWMWRLDLLTMPLFVAAGIALLFGSRILFRTRMGVLFGFLAWPLPFRWLLSSWLDPFSAFTVRGVHLITKVLPVAHSVGNPADATFEINGPAGTIRVVIATVCSGANSLLGFLLVASAILIASTGPRRQKRRWLLFGAVLVWLLNLGRITFILVMGRLWGEHLALGVLHPYVGLILFAGGIGFLVMWALPRFGIELGRPTAALRPVSTEMTTAVPRWRTPAAVIVVAACLLGVLDAGLVDVDPISSALGTPRVARFEQVARRVPGFTVRKVDHFDWTTRYFGDDSDWTRYEFSGDGTDQLRSDVPVLADVITASDAQPFEDFGVEACYRFHGYDISDVAEVNLGSGVVASMLSWHDPNHPINWVTLYWYWAINVGGQTRFQRIVLLLDADRNARYLAPTLDSRLTARLGIAVDQSLRGAKPAGSGAVGNENDARAFLIGFGKHFVSTNAANAVGTDK